MCLYHLHIKCSLHVCRGVQGFQIFKWNSIISICSKVIAFLVISLSPHGPHGPHIIPHHPCHPHIMPIAPEGHHVVPMAVVSVVSIPFCPCCPRGPHVVPMLSPCHPHHPHVIPTLFRRSPHHLQPPKYPLHPPPPPWGWRPQISKNTIRFELIEIF